MSLPDHYLRARTKAGREEVKRREGVRENVIGELKQINSALEFVEKVDDLNINQTKITIAKQRTTLGMMIKQLSEAQMPYDTFGESYSEGQRKKVDPEKKSVVLPENKWSKNKPTLDDSGIHKYDPNKYVYNTNRK